MGCGCGTTTFRDEVEREVFSYIKRLKKANNTKNILIHEIQKDLIKRSEIIEKYNYPYRYDDVEKTVKIYKNYIYRKFDGRVELLEDKIKAKENQENQKNIKTDDNKLILKDKDKEKNKIEEIKDLKNIVNSNTDNQKQKQNNIDDKIDNENKKSMANNKNDEKPESILKSDLKPMLEDKIKNYSEHDESKEIKEKSIDNIKDFLPTKNDNSEKKVYNINEREEVIKSLKSEKDSEKSNERKNKRNKNEKEKIRID